MKLYNTNIWSGILSLAFAVAVLGCEDPEYIDPNIEVTPSTFTAKVTMINAGADAGSLDFYVNGNKIGSSVPNGTGQTGYTTIGITSNGTFQNTSIRAKATTGTIGGTLGSSDLIYRAGNNSTNNFTASNSGIYTLIVVDSLSRPRPVRTLNAANFADTTFFNQFTGKFISRVEKAALAAAQRTRVVPIGTVPLGSSDPGGLRFVLLTDNVPTFSPTNDTDASIRFVHAVPNAPAVWVRLVPISGGSNITIGSNVPYVLGYPGFSPSVGSRSTTNNFTNRVIATAGTPISYKVEIHSNSAFTNLVYSTGDANPIAFQPGKIYTITASGFLGGTGDKALKASVTLHN